MEVILDQFQQGIRREHTQFLPPVRVHEIPPKVRRREAVVNDWVPRVAVERQELRFLALQLRGHVDRVVVHRKVNQAPREEHFARVAPPILRDGVLDVLAGEMIFQLDADDGQAVKQDDHIHGLVGGLGGEVDLPHDGKAVTRVMRQMFRVAAGGRLEEHQLQIDPVEGSPVPKYLQRPALGYQRRHLCGQHLPRRTGKLFRQLRPLLRLRGLDESGQLLHVQQCRQIKRRRRPFAVKWTGGQQCETMPLSAADSRNRWASLGDFIVFLCFDLLIRKDRQQIRHSSPIYRIFFKLA